MAPKLWTTPYSYNSLRPEMVLAEKGITDYETIEADIMTGSHKTPEFMEKSMFGRVPMLEDGDVILFESRAIAKYFVYKYVDVGPRLMPASNADIKTKAVWDMWLTIEVEEFNMHAVPVNSQMTIAPALGKPSDQSIIDRHTPRVMECVIVLDKHLGKSKYMGSDEFSLVDINFMPMIHMLNHCLKSKVMDGRSNLDRWWKDVSSRESWKKCCGQLDATYGHVIKGWND